MSVILCECAGLWAALRAARAVGADGSEVLRRQVLGPGVVGRSARIAKALDALMATVWRLASVDPLVGDRRRLYQGARVRAGCVQGARARGGAVMGGDPKEGESMILINEANPQTDSSSTTAKWTRG